MERKDESRLQEGDMVTDKSVQPEPFGRFLIEIFDDWVRRDVGRTFVLNFDGALAGWLGMAGTVCILGPICGLGMAIVAGEQGHLKAKFASTGRNDPCPCGSGMKLKKCHAN